jgi:hypothetical protein
MQNEKWKVAEEIIAGLLLNLTIQIHFAEINMRNRKP